MLFFKDLKSKNFKCKCGGNKFFRDVSNKEKNIIVCEKCGDWFEANPKQMFEMMNKLESIYSNEIKFDTEELKSIFGENIDFIEMNNNNLLFKDTQIRIIYKEKDKKQDDIIITLEEYSKILSKHNDPNNIFKNEVSIRVLKLPAIVENALIRAKILCLNQLQELNEEELKNIKGIGDKAVSRIKDSLCNKGFIT